MAREQYAHQAAVGHYQKALAYLKDQKDYERAARTLMQLGLTYHTAFEFQKARQAYQAGFALWQRTEGTQSIPAIISTSAPHAFRMLWYNPSTLDPTMADDISSGDLIEQLFSGLVELSPALEVVPDAAQSWEVSEGGRKYVFHLRSDVRWNDGAPLTAGDFEYAWRRVLDPANGSPVAELLYDVKGARAFHWRQVTWEEVGVRALDEGTLIVELEEPTAYFLHLLADNAAYPVPRHVIEARGEGWIVPGTIVTNGPFRLDAWQPGSSMVFSRNREYHGHFVGNVERVELCLASDWSAALEMYESDALDAMGLASLPPSEIDYIAQRRAEEYVTGPDLNTTYIGFDVSRPPFDDPQVRRAFALATDRETLADVVLRGFVSPAMGGFIPPGMPGRSEGIALPYDPEQARQLLAEAGYPDGLGFPALSAYKRSFFGFHDEFLQAQWRQNLDVNVIWQDINLEALYDKVEKEPPHLFAWAWSAEYPDPDNFLRACPIRRHTRWRNETYDGLVKEAKRVMDHGERMKLYRQADRILIKEAAVVPLYHSPWQMLVKPWIRNLPISLSPERFWKDLIIEPH